MNLLNGEPLDKELYEGNQSLLSSVVLGIGLNEYLKDHDVSIDLDRLTDHVCKKVHQKNLTDLVSSVVYNNWIGLNNIYYYFTIYSQSQFFTF